MSAISDFAKKQNEHNDAIDKAVEGISGDVGFLKSEIEKLQNSPGPISESDQMVLDGLEARTAALADKLGALDALTPPAPPSQRKPKNRPDLPMIRLNR